MTAKKNAFDLASLDTAAASEAPYDLELLSPFDNSPTGMFIQVLGFNSAAVRAVKREQDDRDKKRVFEAQRTGRQPTSADDDADGLEIAIAATVGWYEMKGDKRENSLPFGDARLAFSREEAWKLYANPGLAWVGGQVVRAMYDLGNFSSR